MDKSCWSCGHWLIGGMCFKNGEDNIRQTDPDFSCKDWAVEDTEGTITHFISQHVKDL